MTLSPNPKFFNRKALPTGKFKLKTSCVETRIQVSADPFHSSEVPELDDKLIAR